MPPSARLAALGTAAALLVGCSTDGDADRRPGDGLTQEEAGTLAGLLQRNHRQGGADFVASTRFGEAAVLTLTGEVDFRTARGRAQAQLTTDDGEEETHTVFFNGDEIWFGDVPGLAEALATDGAPDADYLRRPLAVIEGETAALVDVLAHLVLQLSARTADDPRAFLDGGWTWQGERAVDGRPVVTFEAGGRAVAVGAADALLVEFRTPVPGTDAVVTVTLDEHGRQEIDLPDDAATADAADHAAVVEALAL
ncbi:hypothetical protein OF117_18165 [Geodermatophilus sp. YIM 151500]|uniref:hypothetical protein n=1 Tax=Geodermatophilus sp. YIM 151500 TaxID=2984531 RepID=UPI0021E3E018|nr:hypothetical protein [Geodermatophilus sp. YIM 151500]MCV2491276.1 hypothetical protein [Geodermatophilus sp. YIM 151500]